MTDHETASDNHEQEPSPQEALKKALDDAWERHAEDRVISGEGEHPKLTLYTPPDERGDYSKLTLRPSGYQGEEPYEGIGRQSHVKHERSGLLKGTRNVSVNEYNGKTRAFEPGTRVKINTSDLTEAQRGALDLKSGVTAYDVRSDPDYFVALAELINQATPEKPKGRASIAIGRLAAKLTRRR